MRRRPLCPYCGQRDPNHSTDDRGHFAISPFCSNCGEQVTTTCDNQPTCWADPDPIHRPTPSPPEGPRYDIKTGTIRYR